MGKKRANGEGSIYKRQDGKWCCAVTTGNDPKTGKPIRKSLYGKTRQEVSKKLVALQSSLQNGTYLKPTDLTLADYIDDWLFNKKKIRLRDKTFEAYEYMIRVHIKPHLGNINLMKLTKDKVQQFINYLHAQGRVDGNGGLSFKTIKNIHTMLSDCLQDAVDDEKILKNPARGVQLPEKKCKDIRIFKIEEQKRFIEVAKHDRLGVAFILSLASGVRLGELLGLTWGNVDLENGILEVKQQLMRVTVFDINNNTSSQLKLDDVKTKAGKRNIPLPSNVIQLLKVHKLNQETEKKLLGYTYNNNDMVFCSEVGTFLEPTNLDRKFKNILKKAEIKSTNIHSLRHTYASRLLEANTHPKVVQVLLGHESIEVTMNTYSHVLPEVKYSAVNNINNLFENGIQSLSLDASTNVESINNLFEVK